MIKTLRKFLFLVAVVITFSPMTSFAVPSFARQTGMDCAACHTSFPELTPFGRDFKLNGYTLGERQAIPLAAMAQFGITNMNKQSTDGQTYMVKQNDPQFEGMSLFVAGKISDYAGAFVQWTYENLDHFADDGSIRRHSHSDNIDIRLAGNGDFFGKNLIYGLDLNNNPSVQDVWNTTPAWGYPYNSSKVAGLGNSLGFVGAPSFGTIIDGGLAQTVAGVGGYFYWDRHLFGELSFYGTADKLFRPLSYGNWYNNSQNSALAGRDNPYWRLAWNQDWGSNSLMIGTYGMQVNIFPDATIRNGPTNRFTDIAFDTQYQFLSDPHIFTAQATYIHEKQHYDASYDPSCLVGGACNQDNHLDTFKAKASYLFNRKYGATLAYFQTTGSADSGLYTTNSTWKPDNRGYIAELNYNPWTNVRVALQYTGYTKIDGANAGYDATAPGRKASDNNTIFLNTWFAY
jgi:hypothetical protein